ncbi:amidohydrolase 2 [Catenulispora acidiphila DSM 44928]|uniref:Amidohydrolase 2 n=1 Tax=Catenulispora acidiphila (strain DSM 44928 / JCM 14897 / NBRC 102108 / NRRL B-24433 / ID139908) TaxID=479433 RepID=C7PWM9_CATAD|nr:amidohydrolase family protein [Catenulispora acidiphila]ACU75309.1 amidohydrolase 2 [Catenulispora acidiphila DSM 44928]
MATRRQALTGLGALAVTGVGMSQLTPAMAAPKGTKSTSAQAVRSAAAGGPLVGAVDVHAHYLTPTYRQALINAGITQPDGMPSIPQWSADSALATMDTTGIAVAMLSVSSPGFDFGEAGKVSDLVRQVNEEGAAIVKAHPTRFGLMASLPLPDINAAVAEVNYAFDVLKADGIALETNYGGTYLGDPSFSPVLAELHKRNAVVHLHPTSPACWEATSLGAPRPMIEFLFDTTRTITQLILGGVLLKYPGIRFIVPHTGAALPVLADRISAFDLTQPSPVDVIGALKRLHYDVAGFALPRALPALLNLVGPETLLYGSDFPFTEDPIVKLLAAQLAGTTVLTPQQKQAMLNGNAAGLFPRLKNMARL